MAQTPKHVFYVNEGFHPGAPAHEYDNLQDCIDAIGADEKALIIVSSDLQDVPELSLTHPRTDITIDGMEHFKIEFRDTICRVRSDHSLKFMNLAELKADTIMSAGDDINLGFKDIERTNINITLDNGRHDTLKVDNTNFYDVNAVVLDITNRDTTININNSYLKGGTHEPAVMYHEPNNLMTIKNTTLIHGDVGGLPIQVHGTFIPELYIYGCSGSSRLTDGTVTNYIINDNSINNPYISE